MATTKKYVSLEKLGLYDEKIKKVISDGDSATLASAKSYAYGLATNYDASGSASTAEANAKKYTDEQIVEKADAKGSASAVDEKLTTEVNRAKGEEARIEALVTTAQGEVDALELLVGELPEGATATDVVGYIDEKTANIASDATVNALGNRVTTAEGKITALEEKVGSETVAKQIADAVKVETDRATEAESGLAGRIKTIEDDYLVKADKDALQEQITTNANAIQTLTDGVDAEKVDGVKDLIQYVEDHGAEVTGMKDSIDANADAIEAEVTRATGVEAGLQTAVEKAQTDATKANTDLASEIERATGAENTLSGRIATLEGKFGEGEGSVEDLIADAKAEAIATASGDATTKANTAETNAKAHADGLNTAMDTRVKALEAIDHEHANKAELDKVAVGDVEKWNTASGKAHEHANKTVLDGIDATKVSTWDTVTSKANQTALQEEIDRATAAEQANAEAIAAFVECSAEEINAMFA